MTGKNGKAGFIALEGGEGAGKSTQARMLAHRLRENGIPAVLVQDPGTTLLGLSLREILKGDWRINPDAELLLFGACRSQLTNDVIRPSLEQGITVVADRFEASSVAYQGYGRGLPLKDVETVNALATGGTRPDLNIFLDLGPETGLARTEERQAEAGTRRFEKQPIDFHRRVRDGYLARVRGQTWAGNRAEAERWAVIDTGLKREDVHGLVWRRVMDIME